MECWSRGVGGTVPCFLLSCPQCFVFRELVSLLLLVLPPQCMLCSCDRFEQSTKLASESRRKRARGRRC